MEDAKRDQLEAAIKHACQAGDANTAVTVALQGYDTEIRSFLVARMDVKADADEVMSMFHRDVWRGIEKFAWRSMFRTWAYKLARNAMYRFEAQRGSKGPQVPISDNPYIENPSPRANTPPWQKTTVKDVFRQVRSELTPEEQDILILRVDRAMSWNDVARAVQDSEADELEGEALQRETNRLKKQFERIQDNLRERMRSLGFPIEE